MLRFHQIHFFIFDFHQFVFGLGRIRFDGELCSRLGGTFAVALLLLLLLLNCVEGMHCAYQYCPAVTVALSYHTDSEASQLDIILCGGNIWPFLEGCLESGQK